jgi:hypothetical protein
MRIWFTHRICSQAHRLTMTGDKEIHLQPIIDRILDLNLMFGKLNLYEESPKRVRADSTEIHVNTQQSRGSRHAARMRTRHVHYARKSPCLRPSAPLYSVPRGARLLLDSHHAQHWGRLGAGPSRRLVSLEHCIAYCAEQNVWGPSGT